MHNGFWTLLITKAGKEKTSVNCFIIVATSCSDFVSLFSQNQVIGRVCLWFSIKNILCINYPLQLNLIKICETAKTIIYKFPISWWDSHKEIPPNPNRNIFSSSATNQNNWKSASVLWYRNTNWRFLKICCEFSTRRKLAISISLLAFRHLLQRFLDWLVDTELTRDQLPSTKAHKSLKFAPGFSLKQHKNESHISNFREFKIFRSFTRWWGEDNWVM